MSAHTRRKWFLNVCLVFVIFSLISAEAGWYCITSDFMIRIGLPTAAFTLTYGVIQIPIIAMVIGVFHRKAFPRLACYGAFVYYGIAGIGYTEATRIIWEFGTPALGIQSWHFVGLEILLGFCALVSVFLLYVDAKRIRTETVNQLLLAPTQQNSGSSLLQKILMIMDITRSNGSFRNHPRRFSLFIASLPFLMHILFIIEDAFRPGGQMHPVAIEAPIIWICPVLASVFSLVALFLRNDAICAAGAASGALLGLIEGIARFGYFGRDIATSFHLNQKIFLWVSVTQSAMDVLQWISALVYCFGSWYCICIAYYAVMRFSALPKKPVQVTDEEWDVQANWDEGKVKG